MVAHLLKDQPDDPIPFMLEYLEAKKGIGKKPLSSKEREELGYLRREYAKMGGDAAEKEKEASEEEKSESDEEEEEVAALPTPKNVQKDRKPRSSVSAEAFGSWNKKEDFVAKVVDKAAETIDKIRKRLMQSFIFNSLDEKELEVVIGAMDERKAGPGEPIIRQGEDGDNLYVVESGKLACTKLFPGNEEETHLKYYVPGEAFGELALLYNAPRAASITASEDSLLWSLDRATFNHIVKDAAMRKREMYEDFLKQVKLLSNMDAYERTKLADALKEQKHKKGDLIIREGEQGNVFFFVVEGEAVAKKVIDGEEKQVMQYKAGDYFGERALLKGEPRAASIVCTSEDVRVVSLERDSFNRLLGPLDEIMNRNMEVYKQFK